MQTKKINKRPFVLVGSDYWSGLIDWIKKTMLQKEHNINEDDLDLFAVVDDADEAIKFIDDFFKINSFTPNF